MIDKVAWIHIVDGAIISTLSKGKDAFYLPGGKREMGESDLDCLKREVFEELNVKLVESTVQFVGRYEAVAHGRTDGMKVQMLCYSAEYEGTLQASAEIERFAWLNYGAKEKCSPVDVLIFDDLHVRGMLK